MPRQEKLEAEGGVYDGEVTDVEDESGEKMTVPHGKGKYTWSNGDVYDGEWKHERQCGQGRFTFNTGGYYEGEWEDDEQHGFGRLEDMNGVYEGEFRHDKRHGKGRQLYKNGDEYEGEWSEESRHGKGRQKWPAGDSYQGDWVNDKMHGHGVYSFDNGDVYEGAFDNDQKTGQGDYTWTPTGQTGEPQLKSYQGGFKNGKRHGQGIERYRNGDWKAGVWEEGEHNGVQEVHKASTLNARQELEIKSLQRVHEVHAPKFCDDVMTRLEQADKTGEVIAVTVSEEVMAEVSAAQQTIPETRTAAPPAASADAGPGNIDGFLKGESGGDTWTLRNIKLGNMLGQGSYGAVYAGLKTDDGTMCAVKCVELGNIEEEEDIKSLINEVNVMKSLSHSNIVRYLGADRDKEKNLLYIFLEFVPGGSLAGVVKKFGALALGTARPYTKQILFAVAFLHRQHVMHRDIKGDNILLTSDGIVKLADFGCSKNVEGLCAKTHGVAAKSMVGTPYWMAPEVITNQQDGGYSYKADIWSLGCTVCEMLTGSAPWPEFSSMWGAVYHIANSKGPPDAVPQDVPPRLSDFFDKCFQRDVAKRYSAEQLQKHPWIVN